MPGQPTPHSDAAGPAPTRPVAGSSGARPRAGRGDGSPGASLAPTPEGPAVLVGLGAIVALVAVDLAYGRTVNFSAAIVVAPVLTATLARPRAVAAIAGVAFVISCALSWYDDLQMGPALVSAGVVIAGSTAAVVAAHLRSLRQRQYVNVKRIAEVAQESILAPLPASAGPADFAGRYVSATDDALVGGDFYEVVSYGPTTRWVVGDVRGKGVEAVRVAALALGCFREAAATERSLVDVARRLDIRLSERIGIEEFVTAVLAELDDDGNLAIVNCGHPAPVKLTSRAPVRLQALPPTTPLGLGANPSVDTFRLRDGECALFYTDGIIEATTPDGDDIDLDRLVRGVCDLAPEDCVAEVFGRFERATGGVLEDDLTLIAAQRRPAGTGIETRGHHAGLSGDVRAR